MKRKIADISCLLMIPGIIFFGCKEPYPPDPMDIPSPPGPSESTSNGPLTETAWVSFAYHVYSGPDIGDYVMDGGDIIIINEGTTTLKGGFWTGNEGTYPSNYLEGNPDYVMPTAPRIYVYINDTNYIEIIQGSHGGRDPDETSYGVIMWVSISIENEWGGHDRVDVYFRSADYQNTVSNNNNNEKPVIEGGTVSSLAGNGTAGYADGSGTAARFSAPVGIAVDSVGNIYAADTDNNRIRKITQSGVVTNFAGTSTQGYADGVGTAAKFSAPAGIAVDNSENIIYVADTGNNRIRKITQSGVVTTLAGTSTAGYANGVGTTARFSAPAGIAVDNSGNIYVADTGNNRIRKITSSGVVTNLAGSGTQGYADGTGTAAWFSAPQGIAVDKNGNIYVADTGNNRIRKITPSGAVSNLAGNLSAGYANGSGTAARFSAPVGMAVDSDGNIYVADTGNNRVRMITPSGVVTTLAGNSMAGFSDGTGTAARFSAPQGIAVNAAGTIYIADTGNNRIRKIVKK